MLIVFAEPVWSEPISIGFADFPKELSILGDENPAATFVRKAVGSSLTSLHRTAGKGDPGFRLELADNMSNNADGTVWRFQLGEPHYFQNGRMIKVSDVVYSLNRCMGAGKLRAVKAVKAEYDEIKNPFSRWIKITSEAKFTTDRELVPRSLAQCVIVEQRSSELFGKQLGKGANIIGSGTFGVVHFVSGREYVLRPVRNFGSGQGSEGDVVLRGLPDARQGLTALRVGTLDALFTTDKEVLDKVGTDETLFRTECLNYPVVARRGLNFSCDPDLRPSLVGYGS